MPGTWQQLRNSPGGGFLEIGGYGASTMLLLTDGTVMCQRENSREWKRLVPDASGSYVDGIWVDMSPMHYPRMYFASAVLADGRVLVAGGEYQGGFDEVWQDTAEIYDPTTDRWTEISTPGWGNLGDAPSCVLADGRVLVGSVRIPDNRCAIFDPRTDSWTPTGGSLSVTSDEETWVLLPDGSVLAVSCFNPPMSSRYVPSLGQWVVDQSILNQTTPIDITDDATKEIGSAMLLPDGRVFFIGGQFRTALYTPAQGGASMGTWAMGPDLVDPQTPPQYFGMDAPSCLMPNGKVLLLAGHHIDGPQCGDPTFFEFDGATLTVVGPSPFNAPLNYTYRYRMLLLPTGEVMVSWAHPSIFIYTPDGSPRTDLAPAITGFRPVMEPDGTYGIEGKRFNGVSQACMYGDDAQMATNYPLVRLRSERGVRYCRTANHTSMAVATGDTLVSTDLRLSSFPATPIPEGVYELAVVANGIPSPEVSVEVVTAWPTVSYGRSLASAVGTGFVGVYPHVVFEDRRNLFWVGPDLSIRSTWGDREGWREPFLIADRRAPFPNTPLTIVSPHLKSHLLLWVDHAGSVTVATYSNPSARSAGTSPPAAGWGAWYSVTDGEAAVLGSEVAAVGLRGHAADIFWIDANDGSVWSRRWVEQGSNLDAGWSGSEPARILPAGTAVRWEHAGFKAISPDGRKTFLFWVNSLGQIMYSAREWIEIDTPLFEFDLTVGWSAPVALTDPGIAVAGSPIEAVARFQTTVDVFWSDGRGNVCTMFWNARFPGDGWSRVAVTISHRSPSVPGGNISALARYGSHLDVFWVGADRNIWSTWWDEYARNGAWSRHEPFTISGHLVARPDSPLTVLSAQSNSMEVHWFAQSNVIGTNYWRGYSPRGNWSEHSPSSIYAADTI